MGKGKTVLVLDGHTNQALACVRSLGRAGYRVLVAGPWSNPLASWSQYCKGTFVVDGAKSTSPAHGAKLLKMHRDLRQWAVRNSVSLVLPLTEPSCILLNLEKELWEGESGIVVGCAPPKLLEKAFNKGLTTSLAMDNGVAVPRTIHPQSLAECYQAVEQIGLPCIIKPVYSNAWVGDSFLPNRGCTYVNESNLGDEVFTSNYQLDTWPLVQELVPGEGKGIFALCDHGRVVAWFAHQRLRDVKPTGSGSSLRKAAPLDPRLLAPAERLLSSMEWHGPAMVEFRDPGGNASPFLMEVNGRFWTSLQLAVDAGVDFPLLWTRILEGEQLPTLLVGDHPEYDQSVILRWVWGDVKRLVHIVRGTPAGFSGHFPSLGEGLREVLGKQPSGTRLEMWRLDDPLPAVGEWVQGIRELVREYLAESGLLRRLRNNKSGRAGYGWGKDLVPSLRRPVLQAPLTTAVSGGGLPDGVSSSGFGGSSNGGGGGGGSIPLANGADVRALTHVHSTWSHDGLLTLEQWVHLARERRCGLVLFSEHEEPGWTREKYGEYVEACRNASTADVKLLPGIEFAQDGIHLLAFGLEELPPRPSSIEELATHVRAAGSILVLAHPGKYDWKIPSDIMESVDSVEVWNSKWIYDGPSGPHPASSRLALEHGKIMMAGQDAHKERHLAELYLLFSSVDRATVLRELTSGTYGVDSPSLARLYGGLPQVMNSVIMAIHHWLRRRLVRILMKAAPLVRRLE